MNTKTLLTVFVLSLFGITFSSDSAELSLENLLLNNSKIILETDGDAFEGSVLYKEFNMEGIYRISIREVDGSYFYLAEGYNGNEDLTEVKAIQDIEKVIDIKNNASYLCGCNINKRKPIYVEQVTADPCDTHNWICPHYCLTEFPFDPKGN